MAPGSLVSLLRAAAITDHEEVLAAAAATLASAPADVTSHQTRVVALLKLDRFEDALRALAEAGDSVRRACVAEHAYALYKTGALADASRLLLDVRLSGPGDPLSDPKFAHVAAQVAYRAERFSDAYAIYCHLLRPHRPSDPAGPVAGGEGAGAGKKGGVRQDDNADLNDLRINLGATVAQLCWAGSSSSLAADDAAWPTPDEAAALGSFETCYNSACMAVAQGRLERASALLRRAQDLCDGAPDLSDEERKAERLPILIQRAYVLASLGAKSEAADVLESIHADAVNGMGKDIAAVIRNNSAVVGAATTNPFILHAEIHALNRVDTMSSLSGLERRLLERNLGVADLMGQKFAGVESRTRSLLVGPQQRNQHPSAAVLHAAARCRGQTDRASVKAIKALHAARPDDVGLMLTVVQLGAAAGDYDAALSTLLAFIRRRKSKAAAAAAPAAVAATAGASPDPDTEEGVRFAPGLIALAMELYRRLGRETPLWAELSRVVAYMTGLAEGERQQQQQRQQQHSPILLQEAGVELLRSPARAHLAAAGAAFESLCRGPYRSDISDAGMVASFATTDQAKAEPYLGQLPPVDHLIGAGAVDVDALLRDGVASVLGTVVASRRHSGKRRPDDDSENPAAPSAKRRKRKTKLPKSYEEGKAPDPERWLPMRDRSYYRPKGKKGRRKAGEATQGGIVKEDEKPGAEAAGAEKTQAAAAAAAASSRKKKKGRK